MENEHNIEKRSNVYAAKTLSRYFFRGEKYEDAKQVIMVDILNYKLFDFEEYLSKTVTVLDKHRDFAVENLVDTYFIELPKFRNSKIDINDKLNQWLLFIDGEGELIKMAEEKNKLIKEAVIVRKKLTEDEELQRLEDLRDMWASDRASQISYEKKLSLEEGKKVGTEAKQKEVAKKMLEEELDIDLIAKVTGLTEEEIKNLK